MKKDTVGKWLVKLNAADKEEKDWREECEKIYDLYEGAKHGTYFNILWSNTETLRPAIYNSSPKPDVRRRFKDKDPVGKAVSEVLSRTLSYLIDNPEFENSSKQCVLDLLLCGRGVLWIEYKPVFAGGEPAVKDAEEEDDKVSAPAKTNERIETEKTPVKLVQWNDFRHGPGKVWSEVEWVARIIRMGRAELVELFGEKVGNDIPLDKIDGLEKFETLETYDKTALKTAKIYEIWDKASKKRIYIHEQMTKEALRDEDPPLEFEEFFPCPMPAYAIECSRALVPIPPYRLYEDQAQELNEITKRIRELVKVVKIRGLYHPQISEIEKVLEADNNDLLPVENMSAVMQLGGLDKAIWLMPLEMITQTITGLYASREQTKQVIYEITGLSDILRGSSNPDETLGAQQIKAQWGTMRLQRTQREVQRLFRDVVRLMSEIVSEQFDLETLKSITQLDYPTQQEQQLVQMQQQQMQQQGQPPSASMMRKMIIPPWEVIGQTLKSDEIRSYKVDVETDSTVAEGQNRDMSGISELMQGMASWVQAAAPMVQVGMISMEAAKEIFSSIVRRAKLGTIVEDAIDNAETTEQHSQGQAGAPQQQQPPSPTQQELEQLDMAKQTVTKLVQDKGSQLAQQQAQIEQTAQVTQANAQQAQQALGVVAQTHQAMQGAVQGTQQQAATMQEVLVMQQQQSAQIAQVLQSLQASQVQLQQIEAAQHADLVATLKALAEVIVAPKTISLARGRDGQLVGGTAKTKLQ